MQRQEFKRIFDAHHDLVWNILRRRGLDGPDADDLLQEVFMTLYKSIRDNGLPDSIPAQLRTITDNRLLRYARDRKLAPPTAAVPSSTSEKPKSQFDVERALHFREVARRTFPQLSPMHQEILKLVVLNGLSHTDAAEALGIPEGTLKTRLLAAKRALSTLLEPILPPSQREPV